MGAQHDDVKPENFFTSRQARSDDRSLKLLFLPANMHVEVGTGRGQCHVWHERTGHGGVVKRRLHSRRHCDSHQVMAGSQVQARRPSLPPFYVLHKSLE